MLSDIKIKELNSFIKELTTEQINWASGYLAGRASVAESSVSNALQIENNSKKISILFGTETGNSKKLANKLATNLKAAGYPSKVISMDQYKVTDLKKEEYLFLITSTHGEGEPPAGAKKFYDYIHSETLQLSNIKYSVLALGDSSYPQFCQTGKDFDSKFSNHQAESIYPIAEADVDFDEVATQWISAVVHQLKNTTSTVAKSVTVVETKSSGKKFYHGKIATSINLNDSGSNKETYHIEIESEEQVDYLPGDALALIPKNSTDVVNKILNTFGIDGSEIINYNKKENSIKHFLINDINVRYLSIKNVQAYAKIVDEKIPEIRIDLLDLLHIYPLKNKEQITQVIEILNPISPRMYSISSAPSAHDGEVHITVSKNTFVTESGKGFGLCSEYLSMLKEGDEINFYISRNNQFRLPDEDKPIILIGPGTGIAPMRSFLAERDATGSSGKNWLFFGEQHFTTDFLYQTEIQNYLETGLITHFHAAFSRDQETKIYVQDRIKEHGQLFFEWIEEGAYIYISGTKDPMSMDVSKAIIDVISGHGNMNKENAEKYFEQLVEDGRYLADVY